MNLSKQAKRMIGVIIIVGLVGALGSIFITEDQNRTPFLYGIIIGSLASLVRVLLLQRTVTKITQSKKAKSTAQISHLIRLAIAFVALLAGALLDSISLLGVVIGIFSYQVAIYTLKSTLTSEQKDQLDMSLDENNKED